MKEFANLIYGACTTTSDYIESVTPGAQKFLKEQGYNVINTVADTLNDQY